MDFRLRLSSHRMAPSLRVTITKADHGPHGHEKTAPLRGGFPGAAPVWRFSAGKCAASGASAAGALGDVSPAAELAGAILGGGMAAASHATKAGTRVLINASPEPFTNWIASLSEDVVAVGGLYASLHYPWAFLIGLALFVLLLIWLLPKL